MCAVPPEFNFFVTLLGVVGSFLASQINNEKRPIQNNSNNNIFLEAIIDILTIIDIDTVKGGGGGVCIIPLI